MYTSAWNLWVLFIFFPIDIGILLYKNVKNNSIRTLFLDGVAEIISHINIISILKQPYWSLIDRGYGWVTVITRKLQSWYAVCNIAFFSSPCCLLRKSSSFLSPRWCSSFFSLAAARDFRQYCLHLPVSSIVTTTLTPGHLSLQLITGPPFTLAVSGQTKPHPLHSLCGQCFLPHFFTSDESLCTSCPHLGPAVGFVWHSELWLFSR